MRVQCVNEVCELQPNASEKHELKRQILYSSNKFEESIDETIHALKLNENDGNMNIGVSNTKQSIEKSFKNYMIEKLNVKYYFTNTKFEGCKLIEWLYNNHLLSIKIETLSCKLSLSTLKQCNKSDIEILLSELRLATSHKSRISQCSFKSFTKIMKLNIIHLVVVKRLAMKKS